jgi:integrase/recombinase XerD
VRGPKADEARALLDAIDTGTLTGLRDLALIGVLVYTFARVNAVIGMTVEFYFIQGRHGWVRLHEKGGKQHAVPCHHTLERYLSEYIVAGARGADVPEHRAQDRPRAQALWQQDVYRMILSRAATAGIRIRIGDHTLISSSRFLLAAKGGTEVAMGGRVFGVELDSVAEFADRLVELGLVCE